MENFKNIDGLENQFQISDLGTVKRVSYESTNRHGKYFLNEKIKIQTISKSGYYCVSIKGKLKLVHRLIAIAFIPNPENKPCINHKDGNKLNNSINNLEWCTRAENNQHAYDNGLKTGYWLDKKGEKHHSSKRVVQFDLNNKEVGRFGSASEASRITGFIQAQICKCCRGETKKYKQFIWKYINTLNK